MRLRTSEAAKVLGVSASWLAHLRVKGGGPPYLKLGRKLVVYDARDLEDWARAQKRASTSASKAVQPSHGSGE